jgi:hypothetical protein
VGQIGKAESRGLGEKPGLGPATKGSSKSGPRDDGSTGCIAAGRTRPGFPVVVTGLTMWNSHVVEVLQRLTLFGMPVFLASA